MQEILNNSYYDPERCAHDKGNDDDEDNEDSCLKFFLGCYSFATNPVSDITNVRFAVKSSTLGIPLTSALVLNLRTGEEKGRQG